MAERHFILGAAFCIFKDGNKVLLAKRKGTGHRDGEYGLPSGHIDKGELPREALVRELQEEVGVVVSPEDLKFVHTTWSNWADGNDYVNFFFITEKWEGELTNCEPNKCECIEWFDLDDLPDDLIDYLKMMFEAVKAGQTYGELRMMK